MYFFTFRLPFVAVVFVLVRQAFDRVVLVQSRLDRQLLHVRDTLVKRLRMKQSHRCKADTIAFVQLSIQNNCSDAIPGIRVNPFASIPYESTFPSFLPLLQVLIRCVPSVSKNFTFSLDTTLLVWNSPFAWSRMCFSEGVF